MPQMAPLSWMSLMIYFTLILFMINPLNYFTFYKIKNQEISSIKKIKTNWKW